MNVVGFLSRVGYIVIWSTVPHKLSLSQRLICTNITGWHIFSCPLYRSCPYFEGWYSIIHRSHCIVISVISDHDTYTKSNVFSS